MHRMKSSFDDPMAAVPSLQHRVMPDHLLCRGGSTCDRLQWSHWLASAPVASFFTQGYLASAHARQTVFHTCRCFSVILVSSAALPNLSANPGHSAVPLLTYKCMSRTV